MFVHHYLTFLLVNLWFHAEYSDLILRVGYLLVCFALLEFPLFAGLLAYRMYKTSDWTILMLKIAIGLVCRDQGCHGQAPIFVYRVKVQLRK